MAESISWRCPFCGQIGTVREYDIQSNQTLMSVDNRHGRIFLISDFIVCPNDKCKEYTLAVSLWSAAQDPTTGYLAPAGDNPLQRWKLIPPSDAKVLPTYVPKPIIDDYLEACAIKDLSPKASATLARRCLQGMIRDFWGISKARLVEEVGALRDKVYPQTWDAIDAMRHIGNIGAHMEQDINVIIDVDPNEAGLLIELIETLVDDWYVARHDRDQRMNKVITLRQTKQKQKQKPMEQP